MHVAIIGNGVTGVTAALRIRAQQPDWRITLISGESKYHYSRPALMYVFMGHMRYEDTKPFEDSFWEEQRLNLVRGWVTEIDVEGKRLHMHRGTPIAWDKLLIATGSKSNKFGWPGQDLDGVQGLWGMPDLVRLRESVKRARHAVIVGGGLIGIELAEMLHSCGVGVTFLVRESAYWNNILPEVEARMVGRHIEKHGFDLRLETELEAIEDDGSGRCAAVRTKQGARIACEVVGLTAGVSPNIDLLQDSAIPTGRGVLVDACLRSSVPDVFAAGDCAEIVSDGEGRNTIQQVWYTGKAQGEVVGDAIAGEPREYAPGIWFNSAKFLDLEYQTYGRVNMRVERERNLVWEDAPAERALRVVDTPDGVIGFNVMGMRWRHEVAERWIREQRPIEYVLPRLAEANFDPELFRRHETEITRTLEVQLR